MAVPWVQIVQWVPSILEVSRQLLQEARKRPPPQAAALTGEELPAELVERITTLEENERRQAELLQKMAEHLGLMTSAVSTLHKQQRWLIATQVVLVLAVIGAVWFR
jgi:hypothetical protein